MPTSADDVPLGYAPHFRKSPLTDPWEPLFSRINDGVVSIGLRIREPHCNGKGFLHGGLVGALADNAMGLSVLEELRRAEVERTRDGSTISLAIDFIASGSVGQWLEVFPCVLKVGGNIAFANCVVLADGKLVARGNATYRVFRAQTGSDR